MPENANPSVFIPDAGTAYIYPNTVQATFLRRLNRFGAEVKLEGNTEIVHVKNTGRLGELLLPEARVTLQKSSNPARKTAYDLISVYHAPLGWVNIDSIVPNQLMKLYLQAQPYDMVKAEYTWGNSRFDFYMEKGGEKYLREVKGCTLAWFHGNAAAGTPAAPEAPTNDFPAAPEAPTNDIPAATEEATNDIPAATEEDVGLFPDAPTERGVKHLNELALAAEQGYHCSIAFVIQMNGIYKVLPNDQTQPEFGQALRQAAEAGVEILYYPCRVEADRIELLQPKQG